MVISSLILPINERDFRLNYSVVARDRGMTASISIDDDLPRLVVDKPPQYLIPQ